MKKKNLLRNIALMGLGLVIAWGIYYFIGQKLSADDLATYKEAATINYSFQVVNPKDKTAKGIAGVQATIDTVSNSPKASSSSGDVTNNNANANTNSSASNVNSNANANLNGNSNANANTNANTVTVTPNRNRAFRSPIQTDQLTSDASGLLTGGNYSICTKDNNSYAIMSKGCGQRVTSIKVTVPVTINPATVSTSEFKRLKRQVTSFTISVDHGFDIPAMQFKDLFKNISGGVDSGIAGVWSMQTSLVYSDGSGGKLVDNYDLVKGKFYEVGTVDIPLQIATSKAVTTPVVGKNVTVQAYDSSPAKKNSLFYLARNPNQWPYSYSQSDLNHILTNSTLNTTTDSQGTVTGHYTLCYQNKKYFVMSTGCAYKIKGLAVSFIPVASTTATNVNTNSNGTDGTKIIALPLSGSGYAQKDFIKKFASSDTTTATTTSSTVVKGAWKAKSTIMIYGDGTGVKLSQ